MGRYLPDLQFQPYVSSYVGNANKELTDTRDILKDTYSKNMAEFDAIDLALRQLSVLSGDVQHKEKAGEVIKSVFNQIAETGGDYENQTNRIRTLVKDIKGSPVLSKVRENYNRKVQDDELKNKLRVAGGFFDFSQNDKFSTVNADGTFNDYTSGVEAKLDYDKRMQDIYLGLNPDGSTSKLTQSDIDGFLKQDVTKGITSTKVKNYLSSAKARYFETPEGVQDLKRLTKLEGFKKDLAEKDIERRLLSVGMKQVGVVNDINYTADPMAVAEAKARSKQASGPFGMFNVGETEEIANPYIPFKNIDIVVDKEGNKKLNPSQSSTLWKNSKEVNDEMNSNWNQFFTELKGNPIKAADNLRQNIVNRVMKTKFSSTSEFNEQQSNFLQHTIKQVASNKDSFAYKKMENSIKEINKGNLNKTSKDAAIQKIASDYSNSIYKQSENLIGSLGKIQGSYLQDVDKDEAENTNQLLLDKGQARTRTAWVMDKGNASTPTTFNEAVQTAYGDDLSAEEISTMLKNNIITVHSKLAPNNPYTPVGYAVSVPVKGQTDVRTIFIDGSESEKRNPNVITSFNAAQARFKGGGEYDGYVQKGNGKNAQLVQAKLKSEPQFDDNDKFIGFATYVLTDDAGWKFLEYAK